MHWNLDSRTSVLVDLGKGDASMFRAVRSHLGASQPLGVHTHTHTHTGRTREKGTFDGQIQTKGLALQGVSGLNPFRSESCLNGPRLTTHRNRPWVGISFLLPNYPLRTARKRLDWWATSSHRLVQKLHRDVIGDRGKARHCKKISMVYCGT